MREMLQTKPSIVASAVMALGGALLFAGCGGGNGGSGNSTAAAAGNTEGATVALAIPSQTADAQAQPTFHIAPVVLDAPSDIDVQDGSASAHEAPQSTSTPLTALSTTRLTLSTLRTAMRAKALSAGNATPMAGAGTTVTYTPAQVRAAYGLPAIPASGVSLTATQSAQLGAGQTIYIVDAKHDPNIAAELNVFNQRFGLPACTTQVLPTTTALPLAAANPAAGCVFSVAYSNSSGGLTATAPAYDQGWATEIALDVEWAHAIAPLARIVLIEAPDASSTNLGAAVKLANAMGPGVVSMSFGASEGSWTASMDSLFTAPGMAYFAATGDSGAAVSWPAVSANVLAVGGTTLSYSGSGTRSEVAWSGTGGGTSLYVPTPAYQSSSVPGLGKPAHRAVADVAMNADPYSGQYLALLAPGSSTASWLSGGGTSLSTPQWAALVAVGRALRAQAGKPALSSVHSLLYTLSATPGQYAAVFADVTTGSHGTCATCSSKAGWDQLTGLGTPNSGALWTSFAGAAQAVSAAPSVTAAAVSGTAGTALTFQTAVTASNPVSYSLSGNPAGMTIGSTGLVSWPQPTAGTFAVTVVATDKVTSLSGQAVTSVSIAKPAQPPVLTVAALTGTVGKPLTGTIGVADPGGYAVALTLTGIPKGMTLSVSGSNIVLAWPAPVLGSYTLGLSARNAIGLTSTASLPITIKAK